MSDDATYHVPVLLKESIDGLNINPDGVYVDVTFGGGGHSREILSRLSSRGRLFSFDQDADAENNIPSDERLTFVRSNFRFLKNWMRYYGVEKIDGLLADLGVSSHHFDDETRGFSFRWDAPLDMRMNKRAGTTAAELINNADEAKLADVMYQYGELRQARRIASAIVKARASHQILTTGDLEKVVKPLLPPAREKKELARVFQALRIEVNHEMDALRDMLQGATEMLAEGGRLVVITYHSLEDRIVKNVMNADAGEDRNSSEQLLYGRSRSVYRKVNNKVITPSEEEQQRNPRSRSAKLRVAEKIEN
ncbi:MAG: 16S rRNA (cytosine(1402)-N(4))-methyltransferase RsmH [Prevotella sp.]|nr:16S rRNA (cytosine(1402)-N(4))-methyltransferase RsmH [Prevotella sp.]